MTFQKITHRNGVPVLGEQEQSRRAAIRRRDRMYRMGETEYRGKIRAQGGKCAVCADPFEKDPAVDHNHACCSDTPTCGMCNRGLLCSRCNTMLGSARDNPDVLRAGIAYLEKYK